MRATPAGEVGMALPAACMALLARDARAPLSRFSHIASIAFSQCARSGFESSATLVMGKVLATSRLRTLAGRGGVVGCAQWPVGRGCCWSCGGLSLLRKIARCAQLCKIFPDSHNRHSGVSQSFLTIFAGN